MNVVQTKRTLMGLPPRISVLLESDHGYGKSDVIRQIVAELSKITGKAHQLVDFRLAQCEVGDVIGMMRYADKAEVTHTVYENGEKTSVKRTLIDATVHSFAEWFPQDPDSYGFLFLDELPRASRDLQNAVMELALDYRYHFKELPMGWRVIAASNDNMDVYDGAQMDPALYDRFLKIQFKPTVDEWLAYAREHDVHKAITGYINKIDSALMPENIERGVVSPSPRSWVKLSDILVYMTKNGDDLLKDLDYFALISKGFLGDTHTLDFIDYVRNNFKIYSGEDIIEKLTPTIINDIKAMEVPELAFYTTEIMNYLKRKDVAELNATQSKNMFNFVQTIPKECASGFWIILMKEHRNIGEKWHASSPAIKKYIMSCLSKKEALKA